MCDEDAKLVTAALAGDRGAFDSLVRNYQRKALAVAARLLSNIEDSQDVVQDAFLKAYRSLGQLKDARLFGGWLMRIVVNRALNFRGQRARRRAMSLSENADSEQTDRTGDIDLPARDALPHQELIAKELAQAMQEAIDQLPEDMRTILLLFCTDKLPQKEIADIMSCTTAKVKWSVFEARRRLRKELKTML